jgi:GWxTD domain-containing protein
MRMALLPLLGATLAVSCATGGLPKDMNAGHRKFLSEVRYIITPQERRIFLNTPDPARDEFIDAFWKKRDPVPATEANEFKDEYYGRIEQANRMFADGGPNGWLEDRGRIHILLGPPWERYTYPRGITIYGKPTEIWYYGFFPIVFIDNEWNGTYELEPESAQAIALINKKQMELKPVVATEKGVFDFRVSVARATDDGTLITVRIPYRNVWFTEEGGRLTTTLELSLEVTDASGRTAWELREDRAIEITEEKLRSAIGTNLVLEIPARPAGGPGRYALRAEIKNRADGVRVQKNLDFEL